MTVYNSDGVFFWDCYGVVGKLFLSWGYGWLIPQVLDSVNCYLLCNWPPVIQICWSICTLCLCIAGMGNFCFWYEEGILESVVTRMSLIVIPWWGMVTLPMFFIITYWCFMSYWWPAWATMIRIYITMAVSFVCCLPSCYGKPCDAWEYTDRIIAMQFYESDESIKSSF